MLALPSSEKSITTTPACSVEFKHVANTVVRAWLKERESICMFSVLSLIVVALMASWAIHGSVSFLVPFVLLAPFGVGLTAAICIYQSCQARTGTVKFDKSGIWIDKQKRGSCLLPWNAVLRADLQGYEKGSRVAKLLITFEASRLTDEVKEIVESVWLKPVKGERILELDLRAVAKRDHIKLIGVLTRLLPSTRVTERLQRFASPQHNPSFTELWNESLMMAARISARQLEAGDWLNEYRFEIVRKLGAGGQGIAYEAIDHYPQPGGATRVVLKEFVMPVHGDFGAATSALNMVQEEAEIIRRLDSDFAVKYNDLFVEDCRAYLVREFVDGDSLKEMVERNGPFGLTEVYSLGQKMCDILAHLHSQDPPIIHRDFTPDNILVNFDGNLKLIDFDIARQESDCQSNQVVGKPSYLAPEQFRGSATTQSDIYSLGATLFYLSTGKQPTPISTSKPASYLAIDADKFDGIVQKATAIDCQDRYKTVEDLHHDLLQLGNENGSL